MKTKKRNAFVRNDAKDATPIQQLTCNLLPQLVRHDTMEGKDYVVVPMVILTEGVHNGSAGPMYYPPEELAKTPESWNHKPLVVYHPEINGQGVSACDPNILTNRKVGLMMNTKWEESTGRLKSEAWIDSTRADHVDPRIMSAVNSNEIMEVSTGVFVDCDEDEGDWSGESYNGIARNYRPDHLALLPDKTGACSIEDGAGLLRNEASSDYLVAEDPKKKATWHLPVKRNGKPDHNLMGAAWAALHGGYRGNKYSGPERQSAIRKLRALYRGEKMSIPATANEDTMLDNEMSTDNIRSALSLAINEKLGTNKTDSLCQGNYVWVADVYSNFFVYNYDGKLWRLGYTSTDTGVAVDNGDPTEVVRVTEYRTVGGAYVGNAAKTKGNTMNKKERVDAIILAAAALGTWTEADREQLMAMNDGQLELVQNRVGKPTKKVEADVENAAAAEAKAKKKCPECGATMNSCSHTAAATTTTNAAKTHTAESYIAEAPPEIRQVLNHSLGVYQEERNKLVESITGLKTNGFSKEDLSNRTLNELRQLARLAGIGSTPATVTTANFAGMGQTAEGEGKTNEEVLLMPTINFGKTAAK